MPEAVASNSIPAPKRQPRDLFDLSTELEDVHNMLMTLATSSCLAIEAGSDAIPAHFSAGLNDLFRHALTRLEEATAEVLEAGRGNDNHDQFAAVMSKPLPPMMRDRFIMEAFKDGYSQAEIAMLFGLPQGDVSRVIEQMKVTEEEARRAV